MGHACAMWHAFLLGANANNLKCIYTNACGDTVDCSELLKFMYLILSKLIGNCTK